MNIYGVYENGNEVFTGSAEQIGNKFYIDKATVYDCEIKGRLFLGKYDVKLLSCDAKQKRNQEIAKIKLTPFEKNLNEVIRRLKVYGNTILPVFKQHEADRYLNELKSLGYELKVTVHEDGRQYDYVVEVKK